jgi:hypothetical protein
VCVYVCVARGWGVRKVRPGLRCGSWAGPCLTSVMPTSTMKSANMRQPLTFLLKSVDTALVNSSPDIMLAPSLAIHWIVAPSAVAPVGSKSLLLSPTAAPPRPARVDVTRSTDPLCPRRRPRVWPWWRGYP